jgi:hypothetical protein
MTDPSPSYPHQEQFQADELVDRELAPQNRASIRIMLGTLASFSP